ncbi:hypothetical protein P8C59_000741 [Phyllachora maydis]|uniref:Annexin n=1 Tax=Phyllachora maydis TaxID=1825666 RepID=A0AAD9HX07_9PEZI|nr:hypothetical protein P8C59_000741 [Phyllachora maydis]
MSWQQYPPHGQPPPHHGGYHQQPPPPPGQQPYGAPPPPPGQYYQQPAPYQYNAPSPQSYGAPPPSQEYYQQPPQSFPPQPPLQPYNAPYGAPPPGQGYPYQHGGYAQPSPQQYPPTPPSLGYGSPQIINWNAAPDVDGLRKAMKGFGTDERALIRILAKKDALQVVTIRNEFHRLHRRDLEADIKKETSGWFETGLLALVRGPLLHDVHMLHEAMSGLGTKEKVLNDVLLSRSNADLNAIKSAYHHTFHRRLEDAVRSDLSMKTERHFMIVLTATRAEDSAPVVKADIDRDVSDLYNATEGKVGTDEIKVCSILSSRNDNQLRAIAHEYRKAYARSLEHVIRREFSGHMEDALLYQLRHAVDKYMHQAQLLEDAMAGMGTKDHLLVSRVVRSHWDPSNMDNVKGAYQQTFGTSLSQRIRGETSGDYQKLMLACIGEQV